MKLNSSRNNKSLSKSSKSIISITKKNPQQYIRKRTSPYFQPDPIRDTIQQRMKKQKQNYQQRTSSPKKYDHLGKADKIIKDLFKKHQNTKQKLKKMKQQAQKKYNEIHPFTPVKNTNQRYCIEGDVIKRNQIWLRQKKKKQLQLTQQDTLNKLKQCTFSPTFSSKKQSQQYLRQRQTSVSNTPSKLKSGYNTQKNTLVSKSGRKKDYSEEQYEMAKRKIISRMMGSLRD